MEGKIEREALPRKTKRDKYSVQAKKDVGRRAIGVK
jgi:hypothetical protein